MTASSMPARKGTATAVPAAQQRQEIPATDLSSIRISKRTIYTIEIADTVLDAVAEIMEKVADYDLTNQQRAIRSEFFEAVGAIRADQVCTRFHEDDTH